MQQYLDLLQKILDEGVEKESGRANMPNTIGISKSEIRMDLQDGFPLLTTKKMYWKGVVHELLWFLRGDTNIAYLVINNVNIWSSDAYRWYLKYNEEFGNGALPMTMDEFITNIKNGGHVNPHFVGTDYYLGDLGKVYGYQWRNQNSVDQIKEVVDSLKSNPYSRYHIIDTWNKADFKDMALPPCHLLYQFIVRPLNFHQRRGIYFKEWEKIWGNATIQFDENCMDEMNIPKFYLDLNMYQRSVDTFLGVPFNIASMSLLLMLLAKLNNMEYGVANWIGGDTHLYLDHIPMVQEQLSREPRKLPKMLIKKELNTLDDILSMTIDDFELIEYDNPHPAIKAELFTGLKK